MNGPNIPARFFLAVFFAFVAIAPSEVLAREARSVPAAAVVPAPLGARLHANRLFDFIRGNRSRMVQVTTIAFGIGLVILMTSTRKN